MRSWLKNERGKVFSPFRVWTTVPGIESQCATNEHPDLLFKQSFHCEIQIFKLCESQAWRGSYHHLIQLQRVGVSETVQMISSQIFCGCSESGVGTLPAVGLVAHNLWQQNFGFSHKGKLWFIELNYGTFFEISKIFLNTSICCQYK